MLTFGFFHYIIIKHEIGDEVRCGYTMLETVSFDGGNSYGVCRGKDQGGKFKIKHLSQESHAKLGLLYW